MGQSRWGAIIRLTHYVLGYADALWALLYSDDGKLTGRTEHFERGLLLHIFIPPLIYESASAIERHVFFQLKCARRRAKRRARLIDNPCSALCCTML